MGRFALVSGLVLALLGGGALSCGGQTAGPSEPREDGGSVIGSSVPDASVAPDDGGAQGASADATVSANDADDSLLDLDAASAPRDVAIPEDAPGACPLYRFPLVADAAARTCAFTPADVACTTDADCRIMAVVGCGCFDPAYGVNQSSTALCIPPPCPPIACDPDAAYGWYTQDCKFTAQLSDLGVACVGGQCTTYSLPGD